MQYVKVMSAEDRTAFEAKLRDLSPEDIEHHILPDLRNEEDTHYQNGGICSVPDHRFGKDTGREECVQHLQLKGKGTKQLCDELHDSHIKLAEVEEKMWMCEEAGDEKRKQNKEAKEANDLLARTSIPSEVRALTDRVNSLTAQLQSVTAAYTAIMDDVKSLQSINTEQLSRLSLLEDKLSTSGAF